MPLEACPSTFASPLRPQQTENHPLNEMTVLTPKISIESIPSMTMMATQNRPAARPHRSPPRNSDGEITCTHPDCREDDQQRQPIFKRLCEYNKHMDKHERPYKCSNPACRKNPGFTYAGGLLRHQREVHSMHRTKDPFFCPHSSCNRSAGTGFSRRENLEEHLRRRHSGVSVDVDDDNLTPTTTTTTPPVKHNLAPKPISPHLKRLEPLPADRKRRFTDTTTTTDTSGAGGSDSSYTHDLHARLASLQQDNDRMRTELFHRDQHIAELSQEVKRLRSMLAVSVHPSALPPLSSHGVYHQHHPPMT